jgi:hypothetical protein
LKKRCETKLPIEWRACAAQDPVHSSTSRIAVSRRSPMRSNFAHEASIVSDLTRSGALRVMSWPTQPPIERPTMWQRSTPA